MREPLVSDTGHVVRPEPATASAHCFQVASKFWTEYGVLERERDGGFQKPQLIPCVMALSSNLLGIDRGLLAEEAQRVGELNFMILAGGGVLERTAPGKNRSEEHTSELQSQSNLVCRLLLEKKKTPYLTRLLHQLSQMQLQTSPIVLYDLRALDARLSHVYHNQPPAHAPDEPSPPCVPDPLH